MNSLKLTNKYTWQEINAHETNCVCWPTFVSIIWDFAEVNKVGSYGDVIDLIRVSYLDLQAFAERREQLCEDHLLVPNGFITAPLDGSLPLGTHEGVSIENNHMCCDQSCGSGPYVIVDDTVV